MALPVVTVENGTLVADPELRFTQNGNSVAGFRVATNQRKRDDAGNWVDDKATFLSVSAWGDLGQNIANDFHKGDRITLTGRFEQSDSEKDGVKRTFFTVVANSVSRPVPNFVQDSDNTAGRSQQRPQQSQGGFSQARNEEPPF